MDPADCDAGSWPNRHEKFAVSVAVRQHTAFGGIVLLGEDIRLALGAGLKRCLKVASRAELGRLSRQMSEMIKQSAELCTMAGRDLQSPKKVA